MAIRMRSNSSRVYSGILIDHDSARKTAKNHGWLNDAVFKTVCSPSNSFLGDQLGDDIIVDSSGCNASILLSCWIVMIQRMQTY